MQLAIIFSSRLRRWASRANADSRAERSDLMASIFASRAFMIRGMVQFFSRFSIPSASERMNGGLEVGQLVGLDLRVGLEALLGGVARPLQVEPNLLLLGAAGGDVLADQLSVLG